jgi:hypothetical protein
MEGANRIDRADPKRRHRRPGALQHRRAQARNLRGLVFAARLQHRPARRDRAGTELHGDRQRRDARRRTRGNDHGAQREPGGRRPARRIAQRDLEGRARNPADQQDAAGLRRADGRAWSSPPPRRTSAAARARSSSSRRFTAGAQPRRARSSTASRPSAVFQSIPGVSYNANYTASNTLIRPSLGRPLSGQAQNVTVNLIESNSQFEDRIIQLDFRFSRAFSVGNGRLQAMIDVYNALNGVGDAGREQYLRRLLAKPVRNSRRPDFQVRGTIRLLTNGS